MFRSIRKGTLILSLGVPFLFSACTLFTTRPVQQMSDADAAIRAALEVQADTIAPDIFRKAEEAWLKAKKEYKYKNFKEAQDFALEAQEYAEKAELEAIRAGAARSDVPQDPLKSSSSQ